MKLMRSFHVLAGGFLSYETSLLLDCVSVSPRAFLWDRPQANLTSFPLANAGGLDVLDVDGSYVLKTFVRVTPFFSARQSDFFFPHPYVLSVSLCDWIALKRFWVNPLYCSFS